MPLADDVDKKRPRSPSTAVESHADLLSPADLWASNDYTTWAPYFPNTGARFRQALEAFRSKMKRPSADILFEVGPEETPLFTSNDFEAKIASEAHLSYQQLRASVHARVVALMHRKLSRGQFRPGLLQHVQSNTPAAVFEAVKASYELAVADLASVAPDAAGSTVLPPKQAAALLIKVMKPLTTLRGVGPATASLIASRFVLPRAWVAVASHGVCPFMSDEAASAVLAVPANKLKYTSGECATVVELLWEKAITMHHQVTAVTPDAVGHALWAATVLART
jgi:hypothetical protein